MTIKSKFGGKTENLNHVAGKDNAAYVDPATPGKPMTEAELAAARAHAARNKGAGNYTLG